jgi:hypothetical protein
MINAVLLGTLAIVDAGFCGFRDAAGRDRRIEKKPYYAHAIRRGMALGAVVLIPSAAAIVLIARSSGLELWPDLLAAAGRMVAVYGAYATLVVGALGVYRVASGDLRTLATVAVLGPFTLIRPLVICAGGVWGAAAAAHGTTAVVCSLAAAAMIGFEFALGAVVKRPA